jgi:hypothetical protein
MRTDRDAQDTIVDTLLAKPVFIGSGFIAARDAPE